MKLAQKIQLFCEKRRRFPNLTRKWPPSKEFFYYNTETPSKVRKYKSTLREKARQSLSKQMGTMLPCNCLEVQEMFCLNTSENGILIANHPKKRKKEKHFLRQIVISICLITSA